MKGIWGETMEEKRIELKGLPESVKKLLDPQSPSGLKMLAIKGMVPLKPVDYVLYLYQMLFDENEELKKLAEINFSSLPEKILYAVLSQSLPPEVLHKMAVVFRSNSVVLEKILFNNATADETFAMIASFADEKLIDIIARNQVRILRYPEIIKAINENPNSTASQKSMVNEFAIKSRIDLERLGVIKKVPIEEGGVEVESLFEPNKKSEEEQKTEEEGAEIQRVENKMSGDSQPQPSSNRDELIKKFNIPREFYDESIPLPEEMEKKLIEDIEHMSEDRQMALVEVGRHRVKQIMAKSPIGSVALAAVKHKDITPDDIYKIAQDRAANAEAIKYIATHRDYIRVYNIKLKLALNPKTPVPMAMAFVRSLRLSDLKNIAKNAGVSKILQNTAKGIMKMHS
ncbi:MAG: hypothetical protein ACP5QK_09035 [Myxococcota bacterium]